MATKLKKFSYSTGVKAIALLLSIIMFGIAAASSFFVVNFFWKAGYYYGADTIIKNRSDFTLSGAFLNEIGNVSRAARQYYLVYRGGAAFEDGSLEKELGELEKRAIDNIVDEHFSSYRAAAKKYNDAFMSGKRDGEYYEYTENSGQEKFYYYGGYSLLHFINNDDFIINDDGTVSTNENEFRKTVHIDGFSLYEHEQYFTALKDYLSGLTSVKFFLTDNNSDKSYTNSSQESIESFTSSLFKSNWGFLTNEGRNAFTLSDRFLESASKLSVNYYGNDIKTYSLSGEAVSCNYYVSRLSSKLDYSSGHSDYFSRFDDLAIVSADDNYSLALAFSEENVRGDGFESLAGQYDTAQKLFGVACIAFVIAFILWLIALALLVKLCGRREPEGEVKKLWEDRIYNDIHFLLSAAVIFGLCCLGAVMLIQPFNDNKNYESALWLFFAGYVATACVVAAVFADYVCSFARHAKAGTLFKHTLILAPFRGIGNIWKKSQDKSARLPDGIIHLLKKYIPIWAIGNVFLLSVGAAFLDNSGAFGVLVCAWLWLALNTFAVVFVISYAKALDKIRHTVEEAHAGNFDVEFNYSNMPAPMRRLSDEISDMRAGMQTAINNAVKDQRMKAELITNVSHDLKTPLTSVINYVDLIRRCDIKDETVLGYIDVLSEKSERLKRLIEDLTEATKASTGNVEIHPVNVNLYELAVQALGESEDDLLSAGIETRITPTELRPVVFADSQKTFRVFDNMISNVRKYALAGTRAYVSIDERDGYGILTVKNISRNPLDIPSEQLMERFVRGDSSRTGEGSGLGLSIAKDLCELQHGKFSVDIDGDLFKATVMLPLAPPSAQLPKTPAAPIVETLEPKEESEAEAAAKDSTEE